MIIDSHFHSTEMKKKGLDVNQILSESHTLQGLKKALDVATGLDDFQDRLVLQKQFPWIRLTLGLYPSEADNDDWEKKFQELEILVQNYGPKGLNVLSGIGEIGIDNHWKYGTPKIQQKLFLNQIQLAQELELPIIVHNREADKEILHTITSSNLRYSGIMHCFSSDTAFAKKILDLGMYISFAGNLTYKSSSTLREVLSYIPLDRLLFETDSPYLSPVPFRGKLNHPGNVTLVYQLSSEILKIPQNDLEMIINQNFEQLFQSTGEGANER